MPFKFFIPLPGPFMWMNRSRAEKHYDRERRAAVRSAQTPNDRRVRLLYLVGVAFGLTALALFQQDHVGWGVGAILVGAWLLRRGIMAHQEMSQDEAAAEDEAVAAELRRRGWKGADS